MEDSNDFSSDHGPSKNRTQCYIPKTVHIFSGSVTAQVLPGSQTGS